MGDPRQTLQRRLTLAGQAGVTIREWRRRDLRLYRAERPRRIDETATRTGVAAFGRATDRGCP